MITSARLPSARGCWRRGVAEEAPDCRQTSRGYPCLVDPTGVYHCGTFAPGVPPAGMPDTGGETRPCSPRRRRPGRSRVPCPRAYLAHILAHHRAPAPAVADRARSRKPSLRSARLVLTSSLSGPVRGLDSLGYRVCATEIADASLRGRWREARQTHVGRLVGDPAVVEVEDIAEERVLWIRLCEKCHRRAKLHRVS
jgi:hypothetical protein